MAAIGQTAPGLAAGPTRWSRLYGLGSVFAKTMRDSRRAILLVSALLLILFVGVAKAIVTEFDTAASRQELVDLVNAVPPILQGFAGAVVNVGTLGGYLQYKYGTFFPLVLSLWSIVALSGTLASEAARGSLEFVAATGHSRRGIALEKISGHITGLVIAFLVTFAAVAIAGSAFPVLPGDEISLTSAFGYAIWLVLMALAGGAVAFALGPFVGRGAAAGIAGLIVIGGFILNGYQAAVPELAPFASLTWFGWTSQHVALAGQYDWGSIVLLGAFDVVVLALGVEAFARRDIGVTSTVPSPSLPRRLIGLRGPISRAIGLNLSAAIAWGLGIGLLGFVLAASAAPFVESLGNLGQFTQLLEQIFPGLDFATVGGFLQLLFIEIGIVLIGLAAATLVAGWASEEGSGRLEFLLATPLSRIRWALSGGIGAIVDMLLAVVLVALGIGLGGALSVGGDLLTPIVGTLVLAFYGWALIGIGIAVGGLLGARFATATVVIVVLLTWFVQLLGPLFNLPDFVQQLALTNHYGQPMVGVWDWGGMIASAIIALAGLALGAWGFRRRDLRA